LYPVIFNWSVQLRVGWYNCWACGSTTKKNDWRELFSNNKIETGFQFWQRIAPGFNSKNLPWWSWNISKCAHEWL